jgi:hypothetical protein
MLVTHPIMFDYQPLYFVAFYSLLYCIIYTLIYSAGFADAKWQSSLKSDEPQPQPQPQPDQASCDEVDDLDEDYTPVPYNHALWPSPRPVNFVRAIIEANPEFNPPCRRLTHMKAVDILAQRANLTRREFLRTNPLSYSERYMKGLNALYLLKDSLDTLENTLRNEAYKQELRRIENGRCACPRY